MAEPRASSIEAPGPGPGASRRQRPAGGRIDSGTGVGGAPLRYGHWQPGGKTRGVCLLLQGRREFIEKYFETIQDLLDRGYEVFTFDWRGQGKSLRLLPNRQKGHIADFGDYVADLDFFIRRVIGKEAGPLMCLAHSMGGHIALRYAHDHPRAFSHLVSTAPMIGINFAGAPLGFIRTIVNGACRFGFSKSYAPFQHDFGGRTTSFAGNPLTNDPERFADEAYFVGRDNLLAMGGVTYGWLQAALKSIDVLNAPDYAGQITTRTFAALAGQESVVDNARTKAFMKQMPRGQMVTIGDAKHEILRETDGVRAMFWRLADEFLGI